MMPACGHHPNMPAPVLLVDAENVRRSVWPNLARRELEERAAAWAAVQGAELDVVWEGERSADDELVDRAAALAAAGRSVWLATSDRELRRRAAPYVERLLGGGSLARELRDA